MCSTDTDTLHLLCLEKPVGQIPAYVQHFTQLINSYNVLVFFKHDYLCSPLSFFPPTDPSAY